MRDVPAARHVVTGGGVSAQVAPRHGGKVFSLRGAGLEWLLQAQDRSGAPADGFVEAGLSGWDECLPTLDACTLPTGAPVPDHGTVWSRPWRVVDDGWLTVDVDVPPLHFARRIVSRADGLRFEYRLHNASAEPTAALWAAHPQFAVPDGCRVALSARGVHEVIEVHPRTGARLPWSSVASMDAVPRGASRKVYLPPDVRADGATIVRPDGRWLQLRWDPGLVPHLGVWFDNAELAPAPVIAIEPCIGWYDALDRAIANGTALGLAGRGQASWWVDVTAGRRAFPSREPGA